MVTTSALRLRSLRGTRIARPESIGCVGHRVQLAWGDEVDSLACRQMILIPCAQPSNLEYRCVTSRHLCAISRWLQAPAGSSRLQQVLRHTPEPLYVTLGSSLAEGLRATSNT